MKYKQIIIIPAYKPDQKIIKITEELKASFETIIVVNDGSGSDFESIFIRLDQMGCIVLNHSSNCGKGRALKTAFEYCIELENVKNGVITVDADGQHLPEDIIKVAECMNNCPSDVVFGCRHFDKNVPVRSYIGNSISKIVYRFACGINVSDTQTGLRGLPFSFIKYAINCKGERYEYETNMLISIKDNGFRIHEVPIKTVYEEGNKTSHFNPIIDSIQIYSVLIYYSLSSFFSCIIDYTVFALAIWINMPILFATYLARGVSCIVNFSLNRNMVFKGKGNVVIQLVKYLILVVISGTLSGLGVTCLSNRFYNISPVIFKIPVECILYFFNFYFQKKYVFVNDNKEKQI